MFGQMDAGRLKFAIECLLADFGKGNVFFVVPSTDDNYEQFAQPEYGKAPGMVFSYLQDAVDAAKSGNGDRIYLLPGIHFAQTAALQHKIYKDDLIISGLPGYRDATIIKGGNASDTDIDTAWVYGQDLVFKNLTFTSYGANKESCSLLGAGAYGGVSYGPASNVKFENCRFTAQSKTVGNGVEFYDVNNELKKFEFTGCLFEECDNAVVYGAGTAGASGGQEGIEDVIIKDSVFRNCTVDHAEPSSNHSDVVRLLLLNNVHVDAKAGGSEHYIDLANGTNDGLVTKCSFAHATAATAKMAIPAGIKWVNNFTEEVLDSTGTTDNRPD
tara:strand:+ start:5242 stop:6225 length:984 start_codon:yes stop_codon:yes gene_type:complete